jgi:hypothetical protein
MEDHTRPITRAEEIFFSECGTGKVPVIVVFTKFDALHAVAFGELREQGMSMKKAAALAPEHAKEIFKRNGYYSMVQAMTFPPRNFICMGGMNQEEADCSALLTCTAEALDDEMLEILLVSAQQISLKICVEYAGRGECLHFCRTMKYSKIISGKEMVGDIRQAWQCGSHISG